ncbi:MAG: cold-shock protein [Rickettsiales bacterium]|jgi:CspA family cold shock protein|nr:cold-shock protein [Rickettsiales bacterium]
MATGRVRWFNQAKGYGFIEPDTGGPDVFLHITALEKSGIKSLNENDEVQFEVASNRGRVSAVNLEKLDRKK